ncbi:N-methyl-D-aspartate receptor NMDAR2C subunit [Comamonas sp. NLF-1-9]|uniref:HD domain-containing protein n=1 Tax=Comamonas sp. NLF-1-9 TaxID=2853163 RepID=UPI002105A4E3|nr:N-methyl-D-aspartate receptor NMDAR2C subunit [Comamonas sp. NLF-1-9]
MNAVHELLQHSWSTAWQQLGLPSGAADEQLRGKLLAAWGGPERKYHALGHLQQCLRALESVWSLPERPAELAIALWFHDAIYEVRASDNERRSADWAAQALIEHGAPEQVCARVHALVMDTCHAAQPATADGLWMVDIDLGILGASPERYAQYEAQIREEYAWVPSWLYRRKRRALLRQFLGRDTIYGTPYFRMLLELPARRNLEQAVAALGGRPART